MKRTVFYSWQSDLPNSTNRTLIEDALKDAAKEIAEDDSIGIDPVIDRDTQGKAGAPDIASTIFAKISAADLFVADISFVANTRKRSFPNPNVLIELGYALNAKGHEALVLVFNDAYGDIGRLPFDLKMRRILTYTAKEGEGDRAQIKKELTRDFKAALITGFGNIAPAQPTVPITDIIEQNPANKTILLRKYLAEVLGQLEAIEPKMHRDGGTGEDIVTAISKTKETAIAFAKLAETVSLMNDSDSAKEMFQWFARLLEKYYPPASAAGRTSNADGEFYKFIGHEFFTIFVTPFLREGRWELLREILHGVLRVGATRRRQEATKESWTELSNYMDLVDEEGKKTRRKSLHADLLHNRHTDGELATLSPFREFMEMDFLLFLFGIGKRRDEFHGMWYPRSVLYLDHVPAFVREAVDYPYAMRLSHALGADDTEELKKRLHGSKKLGYDWHSPFQDSDIQSIGSTGGAQIIT